MLKPIEKALDSQSQGAAIIYASGQLHGVMVKIGDFYYDTQDIIAELLSHGFKPMFMENGQVKQACGKVIADNSVWLSNIIKEEKCE